MKKMDNTQWAALGAFIDTLGFTLEKPAPDKIAVEGRQPHELEIVFGDRTFKTRSYWQFRDSGIDFMFNMEPDLAVPKDPRVLKITRNDWDANKTTIMVVPYARLFSDTEGDEPELPFDGLDQEAEDLI